MAHRPASHDPGYFNRLIEAGIDEGTPTYTASYKCLNCHREGRVEIKRGKPAATELKKRKCPACGCKTIIQN